MFNWLHKLFNPHCVHCASEREEARICNSCEYLKLQIQHLQDENKKLLNKILYPNPVNVATETESQPIPMKTSRFVPFSVKRVELEREDREKARVMQTVNETIEDLEKEVLAKVDDANI